MTFEVTIEFANDYTTEKDVAKSIVVMLSSDEAHWIIIFKEKGAADSQLSLPPEINTFHLTVH